MQLFLQNLSKLGQKGYNTGGYTETSTFAVFCT